MVWSDEPTEAQLNAIFMLIRWSVPTEAAKNAVLWLEERATRREVSDEMKRLRELDLKHDLSASTCFVGDIWDGFPYAEEGK